MAITADDLRVRNAAALPLSKNGDYLSKEKKQPNPLMEKTTSRKQL
jgi:hypothetical protein